MYSADNRLLDSFNKKNVKYFKDLEERVIPIVIKHNGEIFDESMKLIEEYLPEFTEEYLY